MVDRKQCTVLWHVDNLKISHVNPDVNTSILDLSRLNLAKNHPLQSQEAGYMTTLE